MVEMGKGISFTLTIVVVAMIALVVGGFFLYQSTSFLGRTENFLNRSTPGERDELEQACLDEKVRICNGQDLPSDSTEWASMAKVEGKTCAKLAEEMNIFGDGGKKDIPTCGGVGW